MTPKNVKNVSSTDLSLNFTGKTATVVSVGIYEISMAVVRWRGAIDGKIC